jgi:hypothetical protein
MDFCMLTRDCNEWYGWVSFYPDSVGKSYVPFQGLKHTKSRGCAVKDTWILFSIWIHITYELISIYIYILWFLWNHLFTFNILLGTDAMTSKDTQRRLIKENKNQLRDPNVLDDRRTVSTRSPLSNLKCPMQIIILPGQDDCFYLSEDPQFPEGRQTALTGSRTCQHH